jgi:hypothetical protein
MKSLIHEVIHDFIAVQLTEVKKERQARQSVDKTSKWKAYNLQLSVNREPDRRTKKADK